MIDQLAAAMQEDGTITGEEVELALSRAKVVVREFEMLRGQLSGPQVITSEIPVAADYFSGVHSGTEPGEVKTEAEPPVPEIHPDPPQPNLEIKEVEIQEPVVVISPPEATPVSEPATPVFQAESESQGLFEESPGDSGPQFRAAPLKKLQDGVGINDRYLFQRELFGNDRVKMEEAIAAIDKLGDIRAAADYLKANFRWNKSVAADKFIHLVRRRFS